MAQQKKVNDPLDSIAVLAIGSELLDGRVQDSNTQFIASELTRLGIPLRKSLICDDVEEEIIAALDYLSKESNYIIISGGLGPTTDDLTRESVAKFAKVKLEQREESISRLKKLYEKRNRSLDISNLKQALFPAGSIAIDNHIGTAEGFHLSASKYQIFSAPGVPKELKPMFQNYILPILKNSISFTPIIRESFRVFGLPEAVVGSKISALNLSNSLTVSYRANFPEIHVVIKGYNQSQVVEAATTAKDAVGRDKIFVENQELTLPEIVCQLLNQKNLSISVAESCTGGMLGGYLTALSGASRFFSGGYIVYANQRKEKDLEVPHAVLAAYGAVSELTAQSMAEGCRKKTGSDIAVSITGIAGPEGGSAEKPVGTFYVGYSSKHESFAQHFFFSSERDSIRQIACYQALEIVRQRINKIQD